MSKTLHRLLIATTAAGLLGALPAMAQPGGPGPHGDHTERHQRMEKRMAEHQQKLKQDLKLTAEQESAWTRYAESFKRPAPAGPRPDREALQRMTTPERLDFMQARQAERNAHMNRIAEATRALYGSLTPEQQKLFDQRSHLERRGPPHGKG